MNILDIFWIYNLQKYHILRNHRLHHQFFCPIEIIGFFNKKLFTSFILFIWSSFIFSNKAFNSNIIIIKYLFRHFLRLSMISTTLSININQYKIIKQKIVDPLWIKLASKPISLLSIYHFMSFESYNLFIFINISICGLSDSQNL